MVDGKRKTGKKTPKTAKQRLLWLAKWGLIGFLVLTLVSLAGFFVLYRSVDIPSPNEEYLTETTHVYYADGKTDLGQFAIQRRDAIDYDEMPQVMKDAVVAAENQSFWTDEGIDPRGILRAAFSNASGGTTQGASTITQQYVKLLYLTQERSWKRKIKEAILSLKIQNQLSKEEVLEGYLNMVYFGRGAYGIQAGAQAYFDIDAKDLNIRQAAVLAALLNDPNDLDPANGRDARQALLGRYQYVLGAMVETGDADADRVEKMKRRLPKLPEQEISDAYGGQRGHVLAMVRSELIRLGFGEDEINGGGLEVTTTFTPEAMEAAEQGVLEARPAGFSDKQLHVGAASVEPGTGAIRGIYGGQDYLESQLNWAIEGGQAGSTFKPFAVAAALEAGWSLKDTFDGNSPYTGPDGDLDVENQGDDDHGSAVSLTYATQHSVNTAFVDMTLETPDGAQAIVDTAERMGIPPAETPKNQPYGFPTSSPGLQPVAGVALGFQTVSPINMANGYATIAAGGVEHDPYIIERVVDRNGDEQYSHKKNGNRAISEDIAADTSYALQQVIAPGGTGDDAAALGRPVAGKTGTSTNGNGNVVSSWFVGYVPQLSTAVVYVRGDGVQPLDGYLDSFYGGEHPLQTWLAIMERATADMEIEDFPEPANVDGEAPTDGHEPYVAPPKPKKTPKTEEPEPSLDTDSDGDGTPDSEDACPRNPNIPGSPDEDGNCKVDPPADPDSDGDGNPDSTDPCPSDPKDKCDDPTDPPQDQDSDDDGILDADEKPGCVNDPEPTCGDEGGGLGSQQRTGLAAAGSVRRTAARRRRTPLQPLS